MNNYKGIRRPPYLTMLARAKLPLKRELRRLGVHFYPEYSKRQLEKLLEAQNVNVGELRKKFWET